MPFQPGQIVQPQPRTTSVPIPSYVEPPIQRSGSVQENHAGTTFSLGVGQVMRNPSVASSMHAARPMPSSAPPTVGPGGAVPISPFNGIQAHPGHMGPDQYGYLPQRPPSEPPMDASLRKSPSTRSLNTRYGAAMPTPPPPVPQVMRHPPQQATFNTGNTMMMNAPPGPLGGQHPGHGRLMMPSDSYTSRTQPSFETFADPSPPNSPGEETSPLPSIPVTSSVSANMKCKVFLKQHHAQWKSLGAARLRLYRQDPTNVKQLVVEAEDKNKTPLISTIVLTDGVERVGKTGVAIELSDRGARTGIVYMIQLRNESSAGGLFDSLLAGSDRRGLGGN
jgi:hypothetical protein